MDQGSTMIHHCLQHHGISRLKETLIAVRDLLARHKADVRWHVKSYKRCQLGKQRKRQYGHVPPKIANQVPWQKVCLNLIGPYALKGLDGKVADFMRLTIIDPATGWFEMVELPAIVKKVMKKGKNTEEMAIDK